MKTIGHGILALLLCCAVAHPATAADIVIAGEAGCHAIGGTWSSGITCMVERLVVPLGTRLVTAPGVGLATGNLIVDGVLETNGHFEPGGHTVNRGMLVTSGLTVNTGPLYNRGTWFNHGWLHPHHAIFNEWNFVNDGYFETCTGQFVNLGFMRNLSAIENWGGWIVNEGLAVNEGYLYNPLGSYTLDNAGAFENVGTIINEGLARGRCGSVWYGAGDFSGEPVANDPCEPADAATILGNVVLALAPRDVLSKSDTIHLSGLAFRAGKRLAMGVDADAVVLLRTFNAEVLRLVGDGLPEVIGRSLVARADRVMTLIAGRM